jgi:hypothetical protein
MNNEFKYADDILGMYFGESVLSTRALLQRYCFHCVAIPLPGGLRDVVLRIPIKGIYRGPASPDNPGISITNFAPNASASGTENFVFTTALQYWSSGFIGQRGSVRFKVISTMQNPEGQHPMLIGSWQATENPDAFFTANANTSYNNTDIFSQSIASQLSYGAQIESAKQNATVEVEIPFYANSKFIHCRSTRNRIRTAQFVLTNSLVQTTPQTTNAYGGYYVFMAAGDDFSLLGFVGPPRMYLDVPYPFRV